MAYRVFFKQTAFFYLRLTAGRKFGITLKSLETTMLERDGRWLKLATKKGKWNKQILKCSQNNQRSQKEYGNV